MTTAQQNFSSDNIGVKHFCKLILLVSAVLQLTRILQVQSPTGEVPFLSANDRSRWCTIAALAVNGTYAIDEVLQIKDPKTKRRTWYTIDLVRHRAGDGMQHFYSSKPPLLPTLYTGVYLVIRSATGATLMSDPFLVARMMLVVLHLVPLVGCWFLFLRWLSTEKLDPWAMIIATFFVAFGTFLSTFVITLNNHLPAAFAIAISIGCLDRIGLKKDRSWWPFAICGLATSFGAANELPALSWVAATGVFLAFVDLRKMLLAYMPALVPVALAFFVANFAAHGEWMPAYAHRGVGERLSEIEVSPQIDIVDISLEELTSKIQELGVPMSSQATIQPARREGIYEVWDEANQTRIALRTDSYEGGQQIVGIYEWGDWYDYPESYWTSSKKRGVDRGEPNRILYAVHSLIGHHGIFSLTPFWLVSIYGCVCIWRFSANWNVFENKEALLALAVIATSIVSIGFYLARPLEDRNYGGVACGFRWAFWLAPLWIWLAIRGLRHISQPLTQRFLEVLLLLSIFSACFPWANPWTSPWPMQLMEDMGASSILR